MLTWIAHLIKVLGHFGFTLHYYGSFFNTYIQYIALCYSLQLTLFWELFSHGFSLCSHLCTPQRRHIYANGHPILPLSTHLKLFTKVIQLLPYLPVLIHKDRVGFFLNWEAWDNTCRFLNLIHLTHTRNQTTMLISADDEKAFDWLNWN